MKKNTITLILSLCSAIILFSSVYMLMYLKDIALSGPLIEKLGFANVKGLVLMVYFFLISVPIGYASLIYTSFKKNRMAAYFSTLWGILLVVYLIVQIMLLRVSSPLQWMILLCTISLLLIHSYALK